MSTSRSHLSFQPLSKLAPEVRSHILRDLVLKAAADDPIHPGWPAGAPDRQGGRFRPTTPTNANRLSVHDIPAYHPKHRVPLVDSHGDAIADAQGNPLLRPADLPPEAYVRAGLSSNLGAYIASIEAIRPDITLGLAGYLWFVVSAWPGRIIGRRAGQRAIR